MDIIYLLQCNAWKGANLEILDAESAKLVQGLGQQTCHQQLASQIIHVLYTVLYTCMESVIMVTYSLNVFQHTGQSTTSNGALHREGSIS